ncbi:MAG: NFACT family protein [Deltaproteobacteria bacterium]|nr:NFACT family protein [Deltaproteobacteria bacterium]
MIKHIALELNERLIGGVISRIHEPTDRDIVLRVFAKSGEARLLISTQTTLCRLHLTNARPENPPTPPRFCAFLRSRIQDAIITGIEQTDDRVVRINLKRRIEGLPPLTRGDTGGLGFTLVAELTGKSGNVILLDDIGVALDAQRYFDPLDSIRPVFPGLTLSPLPTPSQGKPVSEDIGFTPLEHETWNEAADRHYSSISTGLDEASTRSRLRRAIAEAKKKAVKKLANLTADRARSEENIGHERLGRILTANYNRLKRGLSSVAAIDYERVPPETLDIRLDARLNAKENVEQYFKRAKKAKTAIAFLARRIPETQEEIKYIDGLEWELKEAPDAHDLEALEEELIEARYLKQAAPERKKAAPDKRAEPIRRTTSKHGFVILRGTSGTGNDLIVRKYAKDEDVWLHALGCPGAHVLIKAGGKKPDMATIEEAASIAAHYSKNKDATKAEVIYTEAKNVKKPKGAKPGQVLVSEYKNIVVKPEDGG